MGGMWGQTPPSRRTTVEQSFVEPGGSPSIPDRVHRVTPTTRGSGTPPVPTGTIRVDVPLHSVFGLPSLPRSFDTGTVTSW